jgi:hypothetical protein
VRGEILKLKTKTIFGDFAADDRGYRSRPSGRTAVWPDEVATAKQRFPTPPW